MTRSDERDRRGAMVFSAHVPASPADECVVTHFRSPRTTSVIPLGQPGPEGIALAAASVGRRDLTVVLDLLGNGELRETPAPYRVAIERMLPGAEVCVCDPGELYRFLWFFRDHEDPLTLGHSSRREILDSTWPGAAPPRYRAARVEPGALQTARELLFEMGNALGVRPPIPSPDGGTKGWGARRIAGVADAVFGLYAGLLYRWGSPLAKVRFDREGVARLELADR